MSYFHDEDILMLCAAAQRWSGHEISAQGWLTGGDEALVLNCDPWVLHLSPSWRAAEGLHWCHQIAQLAHLYIPEAVAPFAVSHDSFFRWREYWVTLFPKISGEHMNLNIESLRHEAAIVLAQIHQLPVEQLPLQPHGIPQSPFSPSCPDVLKDSLLDEQWQQVLTRSPTWGLCHGDYYAENLLCHQGHLIGVIDWHDAHYGPLLLELAGACFELGHCRDGYLDLERALSFLKAYRVHSCALASWEYTAIPLAIRLWLRHDALNSMAWGSALMSDYVQQQIKAFKRLGEISFSVE